MGDWWIFSPEVLERKRKRSAFGRSPALESLPRRAPASKYAGRRAGERELELDGQLLDGGCRVRAEGCCEPRERFPNLRRNLPTGCTNPGYSPHLSVFGLNRARVFLARPQPRLWASSAAGLTISPCPRSPSCALPPSPLHTEHHRSKHSEDLPTTSSAPPTCLRRLTPLRPQLVHIPLHR